jgi:hypothetical protein
MKWFKKKKYKFDEDALVAEIMYRIRALFLDSQLKDAFALGVIAGTTYVSDEVAEMEQRASDERVEKIAHLFPLIFAQTYSIAKATTELQRTKMGDAAKELPDEFWDHFAATNQELTIAAVVGNLSQMVDLHLISVGPRRPKL